MKKLTWEQAQALYKAQGKKGALRREQAFLDMQELGDIDPTLAYSDKAYFDNLGAVINAIPTPQDMNTYLTNIQNRLAKIKFNTITGNRNELFMRCLKDVVPSGDSVELQYTSFGETEGYDKTKYIPTETSGGELILSQTARLSNDPTPNNPDKRLLQKVVPVQTIEQALLHAITSGMASGWPTIIEEQMRGTWNSFKLSRQKMMIQRLGFTPTTTANVYNPMWTDPTNIWTPNPGSFIEVEVDITDETSFNAFLKQVYGTSSIMEGDYSTAYNPAGIPQITMKESMSLILQSELDPFWRSTNSILFNSKVIDLQQQYKRVEFLKMLPTMDNKEVYAVLYNDEPIEHHPFTEGIMRASQFFGLNLMQAYYDHFWLLSTINLSRPVVIFTKKAA